MLKLFNRRNKKAFSLIELIAAIAIMAVLIALLVPSLLRYVESSRAQKDESSCDEVINAVQLAVSSDAIFDEMYEYSCANNFLTYSDSSGVYGSQDSNEEYWAPDGCGRAVTITMNPVNGKYSLDKAIVNDMTYGNGSVADSRTISGTNTTSPQCYLKECDNGLLYNRLIETIGHEITLNSQTYRNSSYTIFIRFNGQDNTKIATVYGMFNGMNLTENSLASTGTGTSTYDTNGSANTTKTAETTKQSDKKTSALTSSGSDGSASLSISYKNDSSSSDDGFTITTTLTGVKAKAGNASSIKKGGSKELTFEIDGEFEMPDTITVTGADFTWDKATGKVSLSNATGDVSIEIKAKGENDKVLCFTANTAGSEISLIPGGTQTLGQNFKYSTDGVTWNVLTPYSTVITLANAGDKVYIKGNNPKGVNESSASFFYFYMSGSIAASGNIMSLIDDGACTTTTIPNEWCFFYLFKDCTALTSAPKLPATVLKQACYYRMFDGCTNLTASPELPATEAPASCYYKMFKGCKNMTTASEISATTVGESCFSYMFYNCTNLHEIKISYSGSWDSNYFSNWVYNVPNGSSYKIYYNGSDKTQGYSAIPFDWKVVK